MNKKPRLHMLGLFHTKTNLDYSHCAFTGKVLRFPKMMQQYGYDVIEYSNEGSTSNATEQVNIFNNSEYQKYFGHIKKTDFFGDYAVIGSPAYVDFSAKLLTELKYRVLPNDIICHPFSYTHDNFITEFPKNRHVETGIGYPISLNSTFRIFESYAWLHFHQGKYNRTGNNYEWVIPNYFDIEEWIPNYNVGSYIAFLGRINKIKGLDTILEIANILDYPIKIAGQGDPNKWKHKNIEYLGPITGKERSEFLGNALCTLMPTEFIEPFGGVAVESMLCGTPVITVDYGAFTETIIEGVNGYRCHTLHDWLSGIINAQYLNRQQISNMARKKYSLETCGAMYDRVFTDINDLNYKGWYTIK